MPPEFRAGTRHWARVSSNVRQIGESNGVFVDFGEEEMNLYSGVVRGRDIATLSPGDKLRVIVNRTFYHTGKEQWKFELGFGGDDQVCFPLVRAGYIIVPKENTWSGLNGAIPEAFTEYVQPKGKGLDSSDPPAMINIKGQQYELLGPEGIHEVIKEISSGKTLEMLVLEQERGSGCYQRVPIAHPKFPAAQIGMVEVSLRDGRITGPKVRCVFKAEAGNPARFFGFVLGGGIIFDYVKPTLQDMAADAGVPVEFMGALQRLQQERRQVELVLIEDKGADRTRIIGEECWLLALPEFPGRKIGNAFIHCWHRLEVGDRAEFSFGVINVADALRGMQHFHYVPKEFVAEQVYQAEVAPLSERGGYSDLVRAYIKGHNPADIPICFLPEAKEGDFVDVLRTRAYVAGWMIALPQKAYSAALEFHQKITEGNPLEAEITSDFGRASTVTWMSEWYDQGYFLQIKVGEYAIKGFVLTGEPKGLKPGDKIAVRASALHMGTYMNFVRLLENIGKLRFELA